jgi:hypothetical protein
MCVCVFILQVTDYCFGSPIDFSSFDWQCMYPQTDQFLKLFGGYGVNGTIKMSNGSRATANLVQACVCVCVCSLCVCFCVLHVCVEQLVCVCVRARVSLCVSLCARVPMLLEWEYLEQDSLGVRGDCDVTRFTRLVTSLICSV